MTQELSKEIETILDELDRNSFSYSFGSTEQRTWLRTQLTSLAERAEERYYQPAETVNLGKYERAYKKGAEEMLKKAIACVPPERTENANPDVILVVRAFNDCREQTLTALTHLN